MTDPARIRKSEAVAIVRIAAVARVMGVEVDVVAAIRSGASAMDVMAMAWSDIVADVLRDDPDPAVVELLERVST